MKPTRAQILALAREGGPGMRKGIIRYWLWGALATPFVWAEWLCAKVYLFIDERRFRIEREWD